MLQIIAAVVAVLVDQLFKNWIVTAFADKAYDYSMRLLPGVVQLTYVENRGASFGMLQGFGWLFFIVAAAFAVVVIWAIVKKKLTHPVSTWSAAAIMAGAVGNAIDRVTRGYVVDMFEVMFMDFAVFNVADIFIVVGGIVFCIWLLWSDLKKAKAGRLNGTDNDKSE